MFHEACPGKQIGRDVVDVRLSINQVLDECRGILFLLILLINNPTRGGGDAIDSSAVDLDAAAHAVIRVSSPLAELVAVAAKADLEYLLLDASDLAKRGSHRAKLTRWNGCFQEPQTVPQFMPVV